MTCPHCKKFSGHRMDLHAHLIDEHAEEVAVYVEDDGVMYFEMSCPLCNDSVKQPLKKRASVLDEYRREIRLVAFDLLLYHLMEKHPEEEG